MLLLRIFFIIYVSCLSSFLSVHCSFVVTCWERASLITLLCVMIYCVFVTYPRGVLDQAWYLIVLIPDLCIITYFKSNMYLDSRYLEILNSCILVYTLLIVRNAIEF